MTTHPLIRIEVGALRFRARLEPAKSPATSAAFLARLPWESRLVQARWSGESAWIPLGDLDLGVGVEGATGSPAPGEILFYPTGVSETEILFPYGVARFASKFGPLEGNHFLTIVEGASQLAEVGRRVLWEGAQPIRFSIDS